MADLNDKLNELNDTPDTTSEYDPADIDSNKGMAILAYLSWLVLIPIFASKGSKFVRFHANQGLVLAIAETAAVIILEILGGIPVLGVIFSIVSWAVNLVAFVISVIGIINVANGKAKELPVIGKFRILK